MPTPDTDQYIQNINDSINNKDFMTTNNSLPKSSNHSINHVIEKKPNQNDVTTITTLTNEMNRAFSHGGGRYSRTVTFFKNMQACEQNVAILIEKNKDLIKLWLKEAQKNDEKGIKNQKLVLKTDYSMNDSVAEQTGNHDAEKTIEHLKQKHSMSPKEKEQMSKDALKLSILFPQKDENGERRNAQAILTTEPETVVVLKYDKESPYGFSITTAYPKASSKSNEQNPNLLKSNWVNKIKQAYLRTDFAKQDTFARRQDNVGIIASLTSKIKVWSNKYAKEGSDLSIETTGRYGRPYTRRFKLTSNGISELERYNGTTEEIPVQRNDRDLKPISKQLDTLFETTARDKQWPTTEKENDEITNLLTKIKQNVSREGTIPEGKLAIYKQKDPTILVLSSYNPNKRLAVEITDTEVLIKPSATSSTKIPITTDMLNNNETPFAKELSSYEQYLKPILRPKANTAEKQSLENRTETIISNKSLDEIVQDFENQNEHEEKLRQQEQKQKLEQKTQRDMSLIRPSQLTTNTEQKTTTNNPYDQ